MLLQLFLSLLPSLVFGASTVPQPEQINVMTYNVKSGKDFLGQTCCWDVPQVDPAVAVPVTHTRMKEMQYMVGLLESNQVEAIMVQENVDGKQDPAKSRCSDMTGMLTKMGKTNIGAVYAGDSLVGERGKPGFIPGFNCVGILYNMAQLEPVSKTDPVITVGYADIPNRNNDAIPKSFPPTIKPLLAGATSDKEDRFFAAWLFKRKQNTGIGQVILASGNWPNDPTSVISRQKAENGITIAGMASTTGAHFQALLDMRKKHGISPIIMGFDFNNVEKWVLGQMQLFSGGAPDVKIIVSEDQFTCCPDIVRNHGPEVVTPKKDAEGKVIPNQYEFKPRKDAFEGLKPFQGSQFSFDHVACVGCDSVFVNGPQTTGYSIEGPFGWSPFTEINPDPNSWKLLNSAEHAPLAGSVTFMPPALPASPALHVSPALPPAVPVSPALPGGAASSSGNKRGNDADGGNVHKRSSKSTSKEASKSTAKESSKSTSKETSKSTNKETSKESGKEVAKSQEVGDSISSISHDYVIGGFLLGIALLFTLNFNHCGKKPVQYVRLLDEEV